ncbi:hypothetical protein CkaCkLH20_03964 [Colletotrichum karsti]|uniref:Uncharacterized protein n=1 Tax=Colletotrichum karsti TaxID=1095194 RepID=A0A9P6I7S4_9PEZI|nr:uncharacterized protein CkaCkLH20_03964 [Colletotrichum karsti]KAF9878472.1 hypothetical protein CkaCkLH20_03964 [Colletotrichum karsti]
MCTYIYTYHKDCGHKQYQNTFKCLSARGSSMFQSSRSLTLDRTIHLPDQEPAQVPNALCDGNIKNAVRPVPGRCRTCAREERELKDLLEGARRARDDTVTAAGVRNSVLGLQKLVAAAKPLDSGY